MNTSPHRRALRCLAAITVSSVALTLGAGIASADTESFPGCPQLSENHSTGPCVERLQRDLNTVNRGYQLQPDGMFGADTRIAVLDFQGRNHLGADGIVGIATAGLLATRAEQTPLPPSVQPPPPTDSEICEASFGDLWLSDHKGGCVPDAAIEMGSPPWECAQETFGKGFINEVKKAYAQKSAEEVAKVGAKETIKGVAKKVSGPLGIFKCVFIG